MIHGDSLRRFNYKSGRTTYDSNGVQQLVLFAVMAIYQLQKQIRPPTNYDSHPFTTASRWSRYNRKVTWRGSHKIPDKINYLIKLLAVELGRKNAPRVWTCRILTFRDLIAHRLISYVCGPWAKKKDQNAPLRVSNVSRETIAPLSEVSTLVLKLLEPSRHAAVYHT